MQQPHATTGVVASIEELSPFEDEYVYDIIMEDTARPYFFANNVLVHNSCYFLTHATNQDESTRIADMVASQVNKSFQKFMQNAFLCNEGYDNIIKAGREVISDRGILVDKKRYVLHLVDLDGKKVDKLKVMGLEMRKTTTPKPIQDFLKDVVSMILKADPWEGINNYIVDKFDSVFDTMEIFDIGLPKGVKGIEEYTPLYGIPGNRIPGHVNAAIHYNRCLERYNDVTNMPISSGMKLKVYYLTSKTVDGFKNIALPTDIEALPKWFGDFTIDRKLHAEKLITNNLRHIFKAIGRDVPSRQSMLAETLFEF